MAGPQVASPVECAWGTARARGRAAMPQMGKESLPLYRPARLSSRFLDRGWRRSRSWIEGTDSMFSPGPTAGRTRPTPSRRAFLHAGTAAALGLAQGDMLARVAPARDVAPPARAVILLWLWGGPSHL